MSRIALVFAISFLLLGLSRRLWLGFASLSEPHVSYNPPQIELGKVEVGQTVRSTFLLENAGRRRLLITNVRPSCQCAVAELTTRVVGPGQRIQVTVIFRPKSPGEKFQRILIETNDPEQPSSLMTVHALVVETVR